MSTRRVLAALTTGLLVWLTGASAATAMGSGNPYVDMQTGVTYTVYQPTYGAGLRLQHVGGNTICPAGTEQNLLAVYGKGSERQFTITEGNPMCSDIGTGVIVMKAKVQGATATVIAYCDPKSDKRCTKADVVRYGGSLTVNLPPAPGLRPTTVWVETSGPRNLSAEQLVRIARSLRPAA